MLSFQTSNEGTMSSNPCHAYSLLPQCVAFSPAMRAPMFSAHPTHAPSPHITQKVKTGAFKPLPAPLKALMEPEARA